MPALAKSEIEALVAWFALASVVLSEAAVKVLGDEGLSTDVLLLLFEQTGDSAAKLQNRLMGDFGFDYISALRISTGVARRCGQSEMAELAMNPSGGAAAASSSAFVNSFDDALAEGATSPPASSEARRKRAEELADKAAQEATENEDAVTTPSRSDSGDTAATTEDGDRTDEHCRLCESCLTVLSDYDIGNICSECNSSFGGPAPLRVSQALSSTADAAPPGAINALPDLFEHGPAVPPLQRRRLGSRQLRRQKERQRRQQEQQLLPTAGTASGETTAATAKVAAVEQQQQPATEKKINKIQGAQGMVRRVLGGIPGLRGWRKCQGDAGLQPDSVRHQKRASMCTSLASLRTWHLLFWMIKGSRAHFVDLYGGERGMAHGLALSGALVTSVELVDRPATTRHVNVENVQGDALKHDLGRYDAAFASPPCQPFSTMKHAAGANVVSKEEDLIEDTRVRCLAAGVPYILENVVGARKHMKDPIGLCGTMFGLPTARHRLLESNLDLLSKHCLECDHDGQCLGARSRLKRIAPDGSKYWCCRGNLFGIYGSACRAYGTVKQWADAMGALWMTGKGLALSLPPVYGQYAAALVLAALCDKALRSRGLVDAADMLSEVPLFDLQLTSPVWQHIREAVESHNGSVALDTAWHMEEQAQWSQLPPPASLLVPTAQRALNPEAAAYVPASLSADVSSPHDAAVISASGGWVPPAGSWGVHSGTDQYELTTHSLSSVHYSRAGPFGDQIGGNLLSPAVARYGPCRPAMLREGLQSTLVYLHIGNPLSTLARIEQRLAGEVCRRFTVVVPSCTSDSLEVYRWLRSHGFRELTKWHPVAHGQRGRHGSSIDAPCTFSLWHLRCIPAVPVTASVQDVSLPSEEKVAASEKKVREAAKWNPIHLNLEAFESRPFSDEVLDLVRQVRVPFRGDRSIREEVPQYPWKEASHRVLAIREMERMISCGALVPAQEWEVCKISCWVVVVKGGKTRCCLDLSKLVNPHVPSVPFSLPRFHTIGRFAKEGTWLMCYDLRDFFFSLTIAEQDRELFGVRHPWTGSLYRCARVPFGYIEAPHVCCAVSEGVAKLLREMGIDCEVFVDDFCLGGFATPEEAEAAGEVFEKLMLELGFQWAPHKKVGPSQRVLFLGIEIDTRPGHACYRLPVSKLTAILADLDKFLAWREEGKHECGASELAGLVGRLSFSTAVVPLSKVHLRLLYDAISVCFVSCRSGAPWVRWGSKPVQFTEDMWEDIEWWRCYLVGRNHWPLDPRSHLQGVVSAGSDASPRWGGGYVSLPAGSEELVVEWDTYEASQHINWQELLTVVWILNWYAECLRSLLILFSVDNMVTKFVLSRGGAKALSLREPAKRAVDLALHFNWELLPSHVAGRRHVRCDGLSRGEKPKIPGVRLHKMWFDWVQSQVRGGFQVVIGQEDSHLRQPSKIGSNRSHAITGCNSFIHPRYDSVATCLWWIFAAVAADPVHTTGVVVLPKTPDATWWQLTAKLRLLAVLPRSCVCVLEMRGIRGWSALHAKHDLCLFMFPVLDLVPVQYSWDMHKMLGRSIESLPDIPTRRWIYVLHTAEQFAIRCAEEPMATLTGDLYDAVEWHAWGLVTEHWSKATPYRGAPRASDFMLRTASGRPMTNKATRKYWKLMFSDADLQYAFDVTTWVKVDSDNRFKVFFDHQMFVHAVRRVDKLRSVMENAWHGDWKLPVFEHYGRSGPSEPAVVPRVQGAQLPQQQAPPLVQPTGDLMEFDTVSDSIRAAAAIPGNSGATHPMDVSSDTHVAVSRLTAVKIKHPSNELLIGNSTGFACSICGAHICFGEDVAGGSDTREGFTHKACMFRVPVLQGSSRIPAVLLRELGRRNLNLVWVIPSGASVFSAVARHYELRNWVFPLPNDDAVRPEVALMAEVKERLDMPPSAGFRVGDLLEIEFATRIPSVERVLKCIIRILGRPVRILSLVEPSTVTPTGAYVTEYHPFRGLTQSEIDRDVLWLISHEQSWHTAVPETEDEGGSSEVNPLEYQGPGWGRGPVLYSLDLHPLLDPATFEAELLAHPPPTPETYERHTPRHRRPEQIQAWLLGRQLQEWDVAQDARRLLRAMSVLVCGSDEKWETLGDIGVGRLRQSPELLRPPEFYNPNDYSKLSWAHYAVGTALSTELACTINFIIRVGPDVAIITFIPRYNIVLDPELAAGHLSTTMRGRSVYITTYRGCCYPVVNIPLDMQAAAGEPWDPPGGDDDVCEMFVQPAPVGGVACEVCGEAIPAGVMAVAQDGLVPGFRLLTHPACFTAGKVPIVGAYEGAPRGSVKFARYASASCFCCEEPIEVGEKIQLKAFGALSGGDRWVHYSCEPVREPKACVAIGEPALPVEQVQGGTHQPQRMVRAAAQHGDARLNAAFRCLTNNCGVPGDKDLTCSCCPRKVHSGCLETRNPFGIEFKCPWCYAAEVTVDSDDVSPDLLRDMALLSINDLDGQRDSEERPVLNLKAAADRYATDRKIAGGVMQVLTTPVLFASMLRFVSEVEGHPKSVSSHVSALKSLMGTWPQDMRWEVDTNRQTSKVRGEIKSLTMNPTDPIGGVTGEIVHRAIHKAKQIKNKFESSMAVLAILLAYLAAFRAGEACETEEAHALHWQGVWWQALWADLKLDDHKFRVLGALLSIIGQTATGLKFVEALQNVCEVWGLQVLEGVVHKHNSEPGEKVNVADAWVVRFSLRGVSSETALGAAALAGVDAVVATMQTKFGWDKTLTKWYQRQARSRITAAKASRYVNVGGGTQGQCRLLKVECETAFRAAFVRHAQSCGLSHTPQEVQAYLDGFSVEPMPVLRHTYFGRPTFMPMKAHLYAKFTEGLWNAAADELWPGGHSLRLTTQSGRHGGCADSRKAGRDAGLPDDVLRKIINAHFRWRDEHDKMMVYYMGLAKRDERLIPTKHL